MVDRSIHRKLSWHFVPKGRQSRFYPSVEKGCSWIKWTFVERERQKRSPVDLIKKKKKNVCVFINELLLCVYPKLQGNKPSSQTILDRESWVLEVVDTVVLIRGTKSKQPFTLFYFSPHLRLGKVSPQCCIKKELSDGKRQQCSFEKSCTSMSLRSLQLPLLTFSACGGRAGRRGHQMSSREYLCMLF